MWSLELTWNGPQGCWLGGEQPLAVGQVVSVEGGVSDDVCLEVEQVTPSVDTGEEAQHHPAAFVVAHVLVQR